MAAPGTSGGRVGSAGGLVLVGVLLAVLPPLGGFNLRPSPHRVLSHSRSRSFGHQVLQLPGARIVVGAPVEEGGGRLYRCEVEGEGCTELEVEGNSSVSHMGMALTRDGNATIACGPGLTRECDRNVYVSGVCVLLDPELRPRQELAPGYQGCLPGTVDLAFLFDGSNSMNAQQFGAIRDFMVEVMEQLSNSSIRFAAVQFSDKAQTAFTLRDYAERPRPRELLQDLVQLRSLTDTFSAIKFVAENIFTPEQGARAGAKRVMIIITDGDATDTGTVQEAEERGIMRYIIGVGNNFNSPNTQLYLSQFASRPSSEFVKVLDSFEKLQGLFRELQAKIYDIEGTSDQNRFHLELSSSGFSVTAVNGRQVTGAVGADNWAGGLVEMGPGPGVFVPSPSLAENLTDTYLGYSVVGVPDPQRSLLAAGAPRHGHVGRVVVFEAVGAYFGATLCALDGDGDGASEGLLVGAPLHFDGRRGGRVHLYSWGQDRLEEAGELWGAPGHPLGRFGAALAALGDLNGDGVAEVAVGAPMEDEEHGAVYIFPGCKGGLEPRYSQRLEGRAGGFGIRFFGQALDGAMDVTGDGMVDLAVGAQGRVLVLSSLPIVTVTPHLSFSPSQIPLRAVDCSGTAGASVRLELCFQPCLDTKSYTGEPVVPLAFHVDVDPQRVRGRGALRDGRRRWDGRLELRGEEKKCLEEMLHVLTCLEDFVTSIRVAVNFSLHPAGPQDAPRLVLNPKSTAGWTEIPFEKNCGADEVCEANLEVSALPGGAVLVGAPGVELAVTLKLQNRGEDAYGATLRLRHPRGLSFRRASATQGSSPVAISCQEQGTAMATGPRNLGCNVSRPVLRANSEVVVEVVFDVLQNSSWDKRLELTANTSSDNEPAATLSDNAVTWHIPVRYAVSIVARWQENSTSYLNFTSDDPRPKVLQQHYQLDTLLQAPPGIPPPSLVAFVLLPRSLPHGLRWAPTVRVEGGAECDPRDEGEVKEGGGELKRSMEKACPSPHFLLFRCPLGPLGDGADVLVEAQVEPPPSIPAAARPRLCSGLWFSFADPQRFASTLGPEFSWAQGATEVELVLVVNFLLIYVGSSVGGVLLLILIVIGLLKCGFFKRSYRERMEEGAEPDGAEPNEGEEPNGEESLKEA
ncbi:integrin alpha-L [Mergus octosetaceus]